MAEIDPATGQPVVQHGTKSPMWDLFGAAQQSGILDTLLQPQNSNVLSMLSQFRPQTDAAATDVPAASGGETGLPGTFGMPWDQGREPYASNDTYREPYNFDKSYWDQRAQMSAGFRQSLNKMPGVFDPLSQATSGYPFFQPNTAEKNKETMYQGAPSFGPWTPGKQTASGAVDSGLLAGLTPEQKSQLLMLLQNAGMGGNNVSAGGAGQDTVGQLPRPQPGFPSRPGFNEPGGWQWNGADWQWIPMGSETPVAGGSGSPTG